MQNVFHITGPKCEWGSWCKSSVVLWYEQKNFYEWVFFFLFLESEQCLMLWAMQVMWLYTHTHTHTYSFTYGLQQKTSKMCPTLKIMCLIKLTHIKEQVISVGFVTHKLHLLKKKTWRHLPQWHVQRVSLAKTALTTFSWQSSSYN